MDLLKQCDEMCFYGFCDLIKRTAKFDFDIHDDPVLLLKAGVKDLIIEYGVCNKKHKKLCKKISDTEVDDLFKKSYLFAEKVEKYIEKLNLAEAMTYIEFKKKNGKYD